MNTTGWNLAGSAKVTNVIETGNQELLLTPAINNTSGAIFFSQPINLSMCKKWKAEFDYRTYDGSSADGIAFCFLDVPPSGFVTGGGLGIPATANGLKICFDTWNNCNNDPKANMPKLELRWGNGYAECSDLPTAQNANGLLAFLRSPNYAHVLVVYDDGNITVSVNDKQIITGYQQFNFNGYLGFTASTGGSTDNQSIKNVVIYTEMPPSIAGVSSHPVCPGDTVHLGTGDNANYTYSWSPAGGLSSATISNPVATASNTTGDIAHQKFFVKTAFKSNPGCSSTDSVTVAVNPGPQVDFEVPVVCLPDGNKTIKNKTVINDGTQNQITYKWTFSDGGTSTQENPQHTYSTAGHYTIKLLATSVNGCSNNVTKNLEISDKAHASITIPAEFCQDSLVSFTGATDNKNAQNWHWDFGDNSTDAVQNPTHTYNSANTFTVSMYAVSVLEGCYSDTATKTITINPRPKAAMTITGLLCEDYAVHFKDASIPNTGNIATRTWYFDDGTQATGAAADHNFTTYGTHTISLGVQNSKGCNSKPYSQTVTINPIPQPAFGTPAICKGSSGVFTDSSTISDNSQAQFTYKWYFGDGGSGNGKQPAHTYNNPGNYNVKMVVTSKDGCADSTTKTFAVSDYPVVDFSVLTTNFCGNLPLQLKDNSTVAYGTLDTLKIFWDASQPAYEGVGGPQQGTVYTHNYPTFGYTNSLQVSLKVQAVSSGHCFTEKAGTSILFASPKLVFDAIPTYCENDKHAVTLNQARDTTVFSGTGSYSGPGVSNGVFTPYNAGEGSRTITYKYTLSNGCSDTITQTVKVAVQPTVSAGQTDVILNGGQIVLKGAASGGNNLSYSWSPAAYLDNNTLLQPTAMPKVDTYFTLKATNDDGCSDTAGVLIKVLQYPGVPNAFSPNGDGINDTWQISYLSSYPDCIVQVFNRYGQQVFRSVGYSTPWNGTYNGSVLPVGTYYYIIATKHLPKPLSGPVTLLR